MYGLKKLLFLALCCVVSVATTTVSQGSWSNQLESVVRVDYASEWGGRSSATAWVIENRGTKYLLTNNHFCDEYTDSGWTGYFTYKNDSMEGQSTYVASDPDRDLCLLTLADQNVEALYLAVNKPMVLSKIQILGYPRGIGPILLDARFMGWQSNPELLNIEKGMWLSAAIHPGSSGSPVLNQGGSVVGIIYAGYPGTYGSMAIPVKEIRAFLREYNGR